MEARITPRARHAARLLEAPLLGSCDRSCSVRFVSTLIDTLDDVDADSYICSFLLQIASVRVVSRGWESRLCEL